MPVLTLVSVIVAAAALLGWFSAKVCRLPITIGTMLLTVISSVVLIGLSSVVPGLHRWAISFVGHVRYENLILHGLLSLLLFAGAFQLDLVNLGREKLAVGLLSIIGTLLTIGASSAAMYWRCRSSAYTPRGLNASSSGRSFLRLIQLRCWRCYTASGFPGIFRRSLRANRCSMTGSGRFCFSRCLKPREA